MKSLFCAAGALALVFCASVLAADDDPFFTCPGRVFDIDGGGLVEVVGGVIWDNRTAAALDERSLLRYMLVIYNRSHFPIWVQCEWSPPGQGPFSATAPMKPNERRECFVKIKKEVTWNAPIPARLTIFGDEQKARKLGGHDVVLRFDSGREQFEADIAKVRTGRLRIIGADTPVLSGFQEMDLAKSVAGTKVDERFVKFVKLWLSQQESRLHWDCTHEVVGVRTIAAGEPLSLDRMTQHGKRISASTRQSMEENRAHDATVEEWQVRSCDEVSTYVVVFLGKTKDDAVLDVARLDGAK